MARPAEFDRNEVLDKAMEVFWRTGFTGTSVTDLVKATSLKPGSLYGAFQSKRALFMEVVDTYAQYSLTRVEKCLKESNTPIQAIHSFFSRLHDDITQDEIGRGCLMVNTMLELATEDDEIREKITEYLSEVEKIFADTLTHAQELGELEADRDPASIAKFLMTGVWGLRVLSSTRPSPEVYQNVINNMLTILPPVMKH
ncbi:MAG: TetR/AcrR family transcriptional regulator [Pontibacterium sp.]